MIRAERESATRRLALIGAALLAAAALALGAAVAGPADAATAAVSAGKPDKPGKPPGGGGGGSGGGGTTELEYAAVGDSFAAGTGARPYLDTACNRSSLGYPKLLDADANLRLTAFPACTGASTAIVISSQVPAIPTTAKRVTLTAVGNDVGFSTVMQNCFVFVVTSSCQSSLANAETLIANGTVAANVAAAVQAIRARAPEAKVVVTGYPLLFDEPSGYQWAARVNVDTAALNDAVAAAAAANGAVFVDVEAAFAGHGIGSRNAWINDWSWFDMTAGFHPNATGYSAYATEIRKVIG
ncbi:SGNH/GDSL hydrolase family protein [Agromyces sp. NPDC004153]